MHSGSLIRALGFGFAIVFLLPRPAAADMPGGRGDQVGWTDGEGIGAKATDPGEEGASAKRHTGGRRSCTYAPLSREDSMAADFLHTRDQGLPAHTDGGSWYSKICVDDQGNSTGTVRWFWRPPSGPSPAEVLAQEVLRYMRIPLPPISMNPPPERDQLVRLPVWLWVDPGSWSPVATSASAGGVTVTVRAEPQRIVWDMGNGDTVACGPGTPYVAARPPEGQSSDCSYAYAHSSASRPGGHYQVTATAEWHATWTVVGAPGGGDLGVIQRASAVSLSVAEAQAINTIPRP